MRTTPKNLFRPLVAGAPQPMREVPRRPRRMFHFFDPSQEKFRESVRKRQASFDVLLGNGEDSVHADNKVAARREFITMVNAGTWTPELWYRINSLDSPWALDDIMEIVTGAGEKVAGLMVPKVTTPEDICRVDWLVAVAEARAGISRAIMLHAILEMGQGVECVGEIALSSPRMAGMSLGPADLAANRRMKTLRIGGGHPRYGVIGERPDPKTDPERTTPEEAAPGTDPKPKSAPPARPFFQGDLWHYTLGRLVDACVTAEIEPFYGPFGDFGDPEACAQQYENAFLMGCVGGWTMHPSQVEIARKVFTPRREDVAWALQIMAELPDGRGGKMLKNPAGTDVFVDDAAYKQAHQLATTARFLAHTDAWVRDELYAGLEGL